MTQSGVFGGRHSATGAGCACGVEGIQITADAELEGDPGGRLTCSAKTADATAQATRPAASNTLRPFQPVTAIRDPSPPGRAGSREQ